MVDICRDDERQAFAALQAQLPEQFRRVFPDLTAPRTVVVVPSLSMDADVLAKVSGVHHYEERMFCFLMLLQYPATRVIYLTSELVAPDVVDYFLGLLPGIDPADARARLTLLACHDATARPLTAKILERPRLVARIASLIEDRAAAHMACFNVTELEFRLALHLGIPIYGCDPELLHLGGKSGSRKLFRAAGLLVPLGYEDLRDAADVTDALVALKQAQPQLRRAVVKLNEGFSGDGNAIFRFAGAPAGTGLHGWVAARLPHMEFAAHDMAWEEFKSKIATMGAIAEAFVDGAVKRSPSAQYRINPLGALEVISTHEQVLGGADGQVFLGCRFPALDEDRLDIQAMGVPVGEDLAQRGVLGRFGIDYIAVKEPEGWRHYAIEINLRKGGTTHPFMMLRYLTSGAYDTDTGLFHAADGAPRYYRASDNIVSDAYRGLTPRDLFDMAEAHGIRFDEQRQTGVVFHLIGALSQFGKLGAVCVGRSREEAERLYDATIAMLEKEGTRA